MNHGHFDIMVTVGIMACNHEQFIGRLLDSVLEQQVDFPLEIIVTDDASADETPVILLQYQKEHPGLIHLKLHPVNIGPFECAKELYRSCRGKYLCFMDGDDYWTFPEKLSRQVRFLDENPGYAGCFHNSLIENLLTGENAEPAMKDRPESYLDKYHYSTDLTPQQLLQRTIIPTASLLFRRTDLTVFFQRFEGTSLSLNWAVHLEIIKGSRFRYMDEKWSVYTEHKGGISKRQGNDKFIGANIRILKQFLDDPFYRKLRKTIYHSMGKEYWYLFHRVRKEKTRPGLYLKYIFYRLLAGFYSDTVIG